MLLSPRAQNWKERLEENNCLRKDTRNGIYMRRVRSAFQDCRQCVFFVSSKLCESCPRLPYEARILCLHMQLAVESCVWLSKNSRRLDQSIVLSKRATLYHNFILPCIEEYNDQLMMICRLYASTYSHQNLSRP